ncbi:MAG: phage tail protein [Atopobiaceae bacterium]|nr:phage tail protein [Atopobiaceae bacterium]
MRFTRFDRWESQLGSVKPISATHEEALDGTDTLTLSTFSFLEKGDRLVWRGPDRAWREHVVDDCRRVHDANGRAVTTATCINSVCETMGDYVEELRLEGVTVATALSRVLANTRWASAGSDVTGTYDFGFEHVFVREALNQIVETANAGEIHAYVTVGPTGVATRRVGIEASRGNPTATRRFTYSKSVTSVRRTVEPTDPITALYLYGKAERDEQGNAVRLTVESVNGGKRYVEDASALARWGRPDGSGGRAHRFGTYTDENCDDPSFLLEQGRRQLANVSQPEVTYEVDVIDAEDALAGVSLGDAVDVVDTAFAPAIRMRDRVSRIRRDLMQSTATGTVTIGRRANLLVRQFQATAETKKKQSKTSAKVEASSPSWDRAGSLSSDYVSDLLDKIKQSGQSVGGDPLFPVRNDADDPTVVLDDLDASNLQGVALLAEFYNALNNLLRVYRKDCYGGIYVDVGMAARRLMEVEQYASGGQLTLYVPSDSIADLSKRGFIRLMDGNVYMRGQQTGLLGASGNAYGTVQADSAGASMFTPRSAVSVTNSGVDIYADSYGAGMSMSSGYLGLSAGNTTLELKSDGVYVNGTKLST